jgi:hypothetical protein
MSVFEAEIDELASICLAAMAREKSSDQIEYYSQDNQRIV